ncbi:hypothetical protein ACFL16_03075 [Patescibacteria group bacterium]
MQKQIEIHVKNLDDEKLFELDGLFFNRLDAHDILENGSLAIKKTRGNIKETATIGWYGTHGACVCFIGFRDHYATSAISPEQFEAGDTITISFSCKKDFDFKKFLRQWHMERAALLEVFEELPGRQGTLDEICSGFEKNTKKAIQNPKTPSTNILRF